MRRSELGASVLCREIGEDVFAGWQGETVQREAEDGRLGGGGGGYSGGKEVGFLA